MVAFSDISMNWIDIKCGLDIDYEYLHKNTSNNIRSHYWTKIPPKFGFADTELDFDEIMKP